jgi:hypothetical protein
MIKGWDIIRLIKKIGRIEFKMKRFLISLLTILIIISLISVFSSSCRMIGKDISEDSNKVSIDINVNEKAVSLAGDENSEDEESQESSTQTSQNYSGELENAKIVFVCASVGAAWNISQHFPQLNIKVYDEYQFDKGYRIQEILNSDKPDIMIIKECAAYFPPDSQGTSMGDYQNLIRDWVNLVRSQSVIPVLTTVVPIDPNNPSNPEGNRQLDSILEFNDWIKQYCIDENISVLDLEKALHASDSNRALNPKYDSGDGLHPNEIAYSEKLDAILIPALENAIEIQSETPLLEEIKADFEIFREKEIDLIKSKN